MSKSNSLGLYPFWIKVDPLLTMELLASIRHKCRSGQALDDEERSYLVHCVDRLEKGLPPKKAFYLTRKMGAKCRTLSERNIEICNLVEVRLKRGYTKTRAYKEVESLPVAVKGGKDANIGWKAIEKIYNTVKKGTASENTRRKK